MILVCKAILRSIALQSWQSGVGSTGGAFRGGNSGDRKVLLLVGVGNGGGNDGGRGSRLACPLDEAAVPACDPGPASAS